MYALVSIGGIVNLVLAGVTIGGVIRPDFDGVSPALVAGLIVLNLSAGIYSGRHIRSGKLRKSAGDPFFRRIPASPDPDDE